MRVEKRVEKGAGVSTVSFSAAALAGFVGLQRYRLLSVEQFARLASLRPSHVREVLRRFERLGLLGSIGNVGLRGGSKAPKLYFLTRSGYDALRDAGGYADADLGPFVRAHTGTSWSPIMAHRLAVIDVLVAVETSLAARSEYRLVETFHEYRRQKRAGTQTAQPETSDFVAERETAENRIVPDAAFIIENTATGGRGLFFVELDRGTERLARGTPTGYSVADKFALYARYLTGGRFAETYRAYGDFRFFTLLFVTTVEARIDHLRSEGGWLPANLHPYIKIATLEAVKRDPFGPIWRSLDPEDHHAASIIKQSN